VYILKDNRILKVVTTLTNKTK